MTSELPVRTIRVAGSALSVFIIALCLCGDARSEAPQQAKQEGRWYWELGLGVALDMHDAQGLPRRDDAPGAAVLSIEPGPVFQARCGWEAIPGVFSLRGGFDTAELSIYDVFGSYSPDPEPSFSGSFRAAEGRWNAIRLEAAWFAEFSDQKWGSLFAGPAWHRIGSIRATPAASTGYGLTSVSSTNGFTGLFGADWYWRLGGSRWALGFSGTWNFGSGAEVRFETDPTSPYDSGSVNFRPWSVSLRLSRLLKRGSRRDERQGGVDSPPVSR
jgi:hypothetical protein